MAPNRDGLMAAARPKRSADGQGVEARLGQLAHRHQPRQHVQKIDEAEADHQRRRRAAQPVGQQARRQDRRQHRQIVGARPRQAQQQAKAEGGGGPDRRGLMAVAARDQDAAIAQQEKSAESNDGE